MSGGGVVFLCCRLFLLTSFFCFDGFLSRVFLTPPRVAPDPVVYALRLRYGLALRGTPLHPNAAQLCLGAFEARSFIRRGSRSGDGFGHVGLRVRCGCGWFGYVHGQWVVWPDDLPNIQHHVSVRVLLKCFPFSSRFWFVGISPLSWQFQRIRCFGRAGGDTRGQEAGVLCTRYLVWL